MKLTKDDYAALERSWITPEISRAAGLYRVNSLDGRELVGRKGGGDYAGIVFPYRLPGDQRSVLDRLRLDTPPVDAGTGKPEHKYLTAPWRTEPAVLSAVRCEPAPRRGYPAGDNGRRKEDFGVMAHGAGACEWRGSAHVSASGSCWSMELAGHYRRSK
jgi:hypothetical protein